MTPEILKLITQPDGQGFLDAVVEHGKSLVNLSRSKMRQYYTDWRDIDELFRTFREKDSGDKKAARRDEPEKVVVPQLLEQIDTFVSFGEEILRQKDVFYELEGQGAEDIGPARIGEGLLERDLLESNFYGIVLNQYLLDAARYSIAILKASWVKDIVYNEQPVPLEQTDLGLPEGQPPVTTMQAVPTVRFVGNKVVNSSPYRFFPDPRLPIYRFQEGEFCADEEYYSYHELKSWEASGMVAGVGLVGKLDKHTIEGREMPIDYDPDKTQVDDSNRPFVITEIQMKIIPSEFKLPDGKTLGKENYPVKYLLWIANDDRAIRFEKLDYPHNNFTWKVGILGPDKENFLGLSLAQVLKPLQATTDWLLNTRIESVRKHVNQRAIINPAAIELDDLRNRRSFIRVKKEYRGRPIDSTVFQDLNLSDNTQTNIQDIDALRRFGQGATGISDNLMGEFASGRRSAREAGNVHANAANRIKKPIRTLWYTGLLPLGHDMLDNLRYGLDEQQIVRVIGIPDAISKMPVWAAQFLNVTKADLQGNYDFKITEGDLPSERRQGGQMLLSWLEKGLQQPMLFMVLGINPIELFLEALNMLGFKNVNRFRNTPEQTQQLAVMVGQLGYTGAAQLLSGGGGQPGQPTQGGVPANVGGGPQGQPQQAGGTNILDFNSSAVG